METLQTHSADRSELDPELLFELAHNIEHMDQEFGDAFNDESLELLERFKENDADKVRKLGAISLELVESPESVDTLLDDEMYEEIMELQEEAAEVAEMLPSFEHYRAADAEKIITGLLKGDESVLGGLPPLFKEALSVRMNQRINELDDGTITQGYFREEVTKMNQIASNALWALDFPLQWEAMNTQH